MVNWVDLNMSIPVTTKDTTVRVLVSSRGKVVGQCSITKEQLLSAHKNDQNLYTVRI